MKMGQEVRHPCPIKPPKGLYDYSPFDDKKNHNSFTRFAE